MGKLIDLINQRFGFWMVLKKDDKSKCGQTKWLCQCECGTKKSVTSNSLRTGNSTSCGCNHAPCLENKKFGKLLVLKVDHSKNKRHWECKCDCGNIITTSTYKLRSNEVISCGCKNKNMQLQEIIPDKITDDLYNKITDDLYNKITDDLYNKITDDLYNKITENMNKKNVMVFPIFIPIIYK